MELVVLFHDSPPFGTVSFFVRGGSLFSNVGLSNSIKLDLIKVTGIRRVLTWLSALAQFCRREHVRGILYMACFSTEVTKVHYSARAGNWAL